MTDTDLRDQLMTLLLAGHETTATALAWTFDLLLAPPRAAAAPARLARGRRGRLPAGDDHRVAAPAPGRAARRPPPRQEPLVTDGLELPAGTDVTPAIWLAHTRADVYPEPFAFRPERFLDEGPDTYAWIPFGGGVRRCIGAAFAEFEMRIVLREVLTRCDLHKASPSAGAGRPPQHHPLAEGRHPGRPHRPPPGARARAGSASSRRGLGVGCSLAQRAIVPEPEITSPSSRTRIGTSLVPLSSFTSARSSSRLPQVQGISR